MAEINRLAEEGPSQEEMLKVRNGLTNDSVRGRQSSLYRAQRLAEYTIYDGDPELFNTNLEEYLKVTAPEIRDVVSRYLNTENRAVLDIIPAAEEPVVAGHDIEEAGEPSQPGAPPPQVPAHPPVETEGEPSTAIPILESPIKKETKATDQDPLQENA
jgi:hypothetical protein